MSSAETPSARAPSLAAAERPNLHYDLSLALHAAVASRLDEAMIARARGHLERWLARGGSATLLLLRWRDILDRPTNEVRALLTDPGEEAAWLRKASPFAGVLPSREREQIVRRVRRAARTSG